MGLRIFHAQDEAGEWELVIAAEDKQGRLMVPNEGEIKTQVPGQPGVRQVVDASRVCPYQCAESS